jgi:hypothetical protein
MTIIITESALTAKLALENFHRTNLDYTRVRHFDLGAFDEMV